MTRDRYFISFICSRTTEVVDSRMRKNAASAERSASHRPRSSGPFSNGWLCMVRGPHSSPTRPHYRAALTAVIGRDVPFSVYRAKPPVPPAAALIFFFHLCASSSYCLKTFLFSVPHKTIFGPIRRVSQLRIGDSYSCDLKLFLFARLHARSLPGTC